MQYAHYVYLYTIYVNRLNRQTESSTFKQSCEYFMLLKGMKYFEVNFNIFSCVTI